MPRIICTNLRSGYPMDVAPYSNLSDKNLLATLARSGRIYTENDFADGWTLLLYILRKSRKAFLCPLCCTCPPVAG